MSFCLNCKREYTNEIKVCPECFKILTDKPLTVEPTKEKNLFTYWEGPMPPFIKYCLKSIKERAGSDVTVHIITPENVDEYMAGSGLNNNWKRITHLAQKVDAIRIGLLYKYGGIYCDADTILLKPVGHLFDSFENSDIIVFRWTFNQRILNGYFIAKKHSSFLSNCLDQLNLILTTNFKECYNEGGGVFLGECIFKQAEYFNKFNQLNLKTFIPFEFPPQRDKWYMSGSAEEYLAPETVAFALNLSQYNPDFKNMTIDQHMNSGWLFGNIIKMSEEKFGRLLPL